MAGHWTDLFTFIGGAVRSSTMTYLAMVGDQSAELRIPACHFTLWNVGEKGWKFCKISLGSITTGTLFVAAVK
jgi:hypothetical protein